MAAAWEWRPDWSLWRVENAVFYGTPDLTIIERHVLLHYVKRLNAQELVRNNNACVFPSTTLVAGDIGLSANSLRGYRRSLERKGYLLRDYTPGNRPAGSEAYDLGPLLARLDELEAVAAQKASQHRAERERRRQAIIHQNFGARAPGSRRLEQTQRKKSDSVQEADAPTAQLVEPGRRATPAGKRDSSEQETTRPEIGSTSAKGFPEKARSISAEPRPSPSEAAKRVVEELLVAMEISPRVATLVPPTLLNDPALAYRLDDAPLAAAAGAWLPDPARNNGKTFTWGLKRHGARVFTMLAIALEDPAVKDAGKYFGWLVDHEVSNMPDLSFNLRRLRAAALGGSAPATAPLTRTDVGSAAASPVGGPGCDDPSWQALVGNLRRRIPTGKFGSWFSQCGFHGIEHGVLRVSTRTRTACEKIRQDFLPDILAAAEACGFDVQHVEVFHRTS